MGAVPASSPLASIASRLLADRWLRPPSTVDRGLRPPPQIAGSRSMLQLLIHALIAKFCEGMITSSPGKGTSNRNSFAPGIVHTDDARPFS